MKNAVVTREKGKTWTVNCTKKFLLREISFKSQVIRDQIVLVVERASSSYTCVHVAL